MNPEQFLYVRYPEQQWTRFNTSNTNITTSYQKELLDKFILMDIETYFFENEKCNINQSNIEYNNKEIENIIFYRKSIVRNNKIDISYLYYYTTTDDQNVEFMYSEPSFVAYINRLVD